MNAGPGLARHPSGNVVSPRASEDELMLRIDELAYRLMLAFPKNAGVTPTLLFTSVRAAEGKTTMACAVARSIGHLSGEPVLLADAHPYRPMLHSLYGLPADSAGLFNALRGDASALARLRPGPDPALPTVLPIGRDPDPTLLFRAHAVHAFKEKARDYRCIVFDGGTTQLGGTALGQHVDGVVVVVDSSRTRREVVQGGISAMRLPPGRVVGAILNKRVRHIPSFLYKGL